MMNPILKRTLCGLGVGALVIGLFLYCPLRALMPIILVLSTFAQLEFYMMAKKKYEPVTWFGLLMGALWIASVGYWGFGRGIFVLIACFFPALLLMLFALCLYVLFNSRFKNPIGSISVTALGFLYVPFLLAFFILIAQLTGDGRWGYTSSGIDKWLSRTGLYTLFALIAIAKFSDTGGVAFGSDGGGGLGVRTPF